MIIFETERLIVRKFTDADYDNVFALNGDAEIMQYIRPVQSREESDRYLKESILEAKVHPFMGRWAVDEKGRGGFVGLFVIVPIPSDPEKIQLGYAFTKENWGKGYATEITRGGLIYFRDKTPLTVIYGVTETPHIASQKVLLKNGFVFEKVFIEGGKELKRYRFQRSAQNNNQ